MMNRNARNISFKAILNRLVQLFMVLLVLLFIYLPIYWLVVSSISTRAELLSVPLRWIPENPTLQNYASVLIPGSATSEVAKTFKITLRNSLVIASSVTIISLVVGSLAAYALVRIRFRFLTCS